MEKEKRKEKFQEKYRQKYHKLQSTTVDGGANAAIIGGSFVGNNGLLENELEGY
jgi:hypothetical protein